MAQEVGAGGRQPSALNPSTGASLAAVTAASAVIIGIVGQLTIHGSVAFAMLAGFGLAVLTVNVFAHQR